MRERRLSNVEIDDQDNNNDSSDDPAPIISSSTTTTAATTVLDTDNGDTTKAAAAAAAADSKTPSGEKAMIGTGSWTKDDEDLLLAGGKSGRSRIGRRPRLRSVWHCGFLILSVTVCSLLGLASIFHSSTNLQMDQKGCRMSYMRPSYARLEDFDTEHSRFASKYSIYLYREENVDDTSKSALMKPKGVPVLFIPGNAGSYKQVRPIAAEAANIFQDRLKANASIIQSGARSLDFFTVDFNEDITAFHGQTLLDQAEFLNEAVAYILSLYHDARKTTKESDLPDPASVILIGHSMGGIVARTMLTMPNYQSNSINTIITMSAPHARPPISFDAELVRTYDRVNAYWRNSYSAQWASHNPLWHVTLVSIAGGGLDTVVPSDYASVASLIPETHGFTAFTSTVPGVWTSMDHQAILWCDQFRKVVAKTLLDVVNVRRPGQTKPRAERMRILKKSFLTGMESIAERTIQDEALNTLLTLEPNTQSILPLGETLVLRKLGGNQKPKAYLLPTPPSRGEKGIMAFTLLTDRNLAGKSPDIEVLMCSSFPLQAGQAQNVFAMNMVLAEDVVDGTRLACKSAIGDVMSLPASTRNTQYPFEEVTPFSYIQYDLEDMGEHQFIAVVDKAPMFSTGWLVAQFSEKAQRETTIDISLPTLMSQGVHTVLPAERPLVTELYIPVIQSSLLAYKLSVGVQACGDGEQLFTPLVRQYLSDPYESKYFVNVHQAEISLHGMAPFMPEPLKSAERSGLTLQMWSDSTCNSPIEVSVTVDYVGSIGKLAIRYRTVFAAFPLLIVALVLRRQFQEYDATGIFITFNEGLELVLRQSLPATLVVVSVLTLSLAVAQSRQHAGALSDVVDRTKEAVAESSPFLRFLKNDALIGLQDPFFWFLTPVFVAISVGVCAVLNYLVLIIVHSLTAIYAWVSTRPAWLSNEKSKRGPPSAFTSGHPRRRLLVTCALLFFVATVIPYQFAYVVVCIVQLVVCIRALKFARESGYGTRSNIHWDFANYSHSLLVLMIWILPINLPVLVVWIHNLAVHWLTPFSSHHNVLSVMPFILLVETLTCGNMVPRCENPLRHITSLLFLGAAAYATIYGVMYAYMLHHAVNLVAAWLVVLHFSSTPFTISGLVEMLNSPDEPKKLP
ncbi:GPI inositol deacylase [Orbilia oligospora]|uniref:GPI inositol-deacylase n=1 Tax=Orbilia oligospora TaxID=2813651 RepID=A0A8H2DMI9_ORBOL|nr:GPI inositol deacylase [Orbilia oligospora]KAF3236300.1 GPI inositol deacylase [Orbilia oligospora]KAF3240431.1 GPI inositol deacylase [Orbilia oligospora]KAF3296952.1 GPI inositol deacylase [Orbilia oligospora]KAF3296953.1 GPI inositol deacylase, variant 2 [Orbilia oligospora]